MRSARAPQVTVSSLPSINPAVEGDATGSDALEFREGMSRVAAAVHVVTTDGPAGPAGFTASAVAPVTDAPPTLLVCINASGRSAEALNRNAVFCVNALAFDDQAISDAFAGRLDLTGGERFEIGAWERLVTGAPALVSSLVSFDCRLADAQLLATHHIVIGEIVAIRMGRSRPALVYQGRAYRRL